MDCIEMCAVWLWCLLAVLMLWCSCCCGGGAVDCFVW